jgi:hypothetical protein
VIHEEREATRSKMVGVGLFGSRVQPSRVKRGMRPLARATVLLLAARRVIHEEREATRSKMVASDCSARGFNRRA